MIRRILVGLGDVEYAQVATRTAIELAHLHGATLTGVSVLNVGRIGATGAVPVGAGHLARELRQYRLEAAQEVIEQVNTLFEESCRDADLPFRLHTAAEEGFRCMVGCARYHDIIVCGLGHLFEHGVIEEPPAELVRLVQAGVRPLMTVTDEYRAVRRVLIAYSGSIESAKSMKRYVQLQPWPDVEIRVVTFSHAHDQVQKMLADAAEYCASHGYEVDTHFEQGLAIRNLLPYADEWNADLIVMGNSNRNLLLRRILGETMLHTVQHADRPLFLAQ